MQQQEQGHTGMSDTQEYDMYDLPWSARQDDSMSKWICFPYHQRKEPKELIKEITVDKTMK